MKNNSYTWFNENWWQVWTTTCEGRVIRLQHLFLIPAQERDSREGFFDIRPCTSTIGNHSDVALITFCLYLFTFSRWTWCRRLSEWHRTKDCDVRFHDRGYIRTLFLYNSLFHSGSTCSLQDPSARSLYIFSYCINESTIIVEKSRQGSEEKFLYLIFLFAKQSEIKIFQSP